MDGISRDFNCAWITELGLSLAEDAMSGLGPWGVIKYTGESYVVIQGKNERPRVQC